MSSALRSWVWRLRPIGGFARAFGVDPVNPMFKELGVFWTASIGELGVDSNKIGACEDDQVDTVRFGPNLIGLGSFRSNRIIGGSCPLVNQV